VFQYLGAVNPECYALERTGKTDEDVEKQKLILSQVNNLAINYLDCDRDLALYTFLSVPVQCSDLQYVASSILYR
jgi:hypothetical protein